MQSYTVKQGDTLYSIARKQLGDAGAWRSIAELNGLHNNAIKTGQVLKMPGEYEEAPNIINNAQVGRAPDTDHVRIFEQGGYFFAEQESGIEMRIGQQRKRGLFRLGKQRPEAFLARGSEHLSALELTPSETKVMIATAENEGNLDAINTWDNHFLSFGMFQWTAGGAGNPGELGALLARIQQQFGEDFEHYWGRFGIGVERADANTGWLTLNGTRLESGSSKKALRSPLWAYRFAVAGMDEAICAAQIAHAVGRIGQFYFRPMKQLDGRPLADLITSEYGVALLLDNHVNRPGYVVDCVAAGLRDAGLSAAELATGSDDDERRLLKAYLKVRKQFGKKPMTDAGQRAKVTRSHLKSGVISDRRGSFVTRQG